MKDEIGWTIAWAAGALAVGAVVSALGGNWWVVAAVALPYGIAYAAWGYRRDERKRAAEQAKIAELVEAGNALPDVEPAEWAKNTEHPVGEPLEMTPNVRRALAGEDVELLDSERDVFRAAVAKSKVGQDADPYAADWTPPKATQSDPLAVGTWEHVKDGRYRRVK